MPSIQNVPFAILFAIMTVLIVPLSLRFALKMRMVESVCSSERSMSSWSPFMNHGWRSAAPALSRWSGSTTSIWTRERETREHAFEGS